MCFVQPIYCCILYDKSNAWETNPLYVLYMLLQILVPCEIPFVLKMVKIFANCSLLLKIIHKE